MLPLLIVDECGPRVNELATAQVGDLDEHRKAIRVRWTVEKNDRYRHLELPDDLFDALLATLPPREDRDLEAPLFPDLTDARLRTAITKACKATGTPHFSPHGLRRRRGSLHYKRTGSLAEVAELLGDSKRVAADHYVYALTDYREVDRSIALARARRRTSPYMPGHARTVVSPVVSSALGKCRFAGGCDTCRPIRTPSSQAKTAWLRGSDTNIRAGRARTVVSPVVSSESPPF